MYHYKVYYQYYGYGSVCFNSIEYSSKRELLTGDDYIELHNYIETLIEGKEICITSIFQITKLSTKKKEKQVSI